MDLAASRMISPVHTADVRTLENSEFHVGRAELLEGFLALGSKEQAA